MTPASWIEVSLTQLRANLAGFRAMLAAGQRTRGDDAPATICGVVKADAFGVGVEPVAQCLSDAGIDMLAVYSPEQAAPFAEMELRCPILLLMPTLGLSLSPALESLAKRQSLHVTIHHESQLHDVNSVGEKLGCRIPVHLMIDTGMSRAGLNATQFTHLVSFSQSLRNVRLAGVFTHMASPDSDAPFTREQAARFDRAVEACIDRLPQDVVLHVANTFATLTDHAHHREMIRVGLGLYGYGPESLQPDCVLEHSDQIKPIVRWLSRIVHVQRYAAGTPVGYNSTHRLTRESVLGLVPVGYADGYPRGLSGLGEVLIRGQRCSVAATVSMDQLTVVLPEGLEAKEGDEVVLLGVDGDDLVSAEELARHVRTVPYEIICGVRPRSSAGTVRGCSD